MGLQIRQWPSTKLRVIVAAAIVSVAVALPVYNFVAGKAVEALGGVTVVSNVDLQGWTTTANDGGAAGFVKDGTDGALKLTTGSSNDARVRFAQPVDVALSEVTDVQFVSKQVAGPADSANASFRLGLDTDNNNSVDQTIVYETYYNGTNQTGNWQTWDIASGKFWGSWNPAGAYDTNETLNQVIARFGNVRVKSISLGLGNYNPSWDVRVDTLKFADVTYDFEAVPPAAPTNLRLNGSLACGYATNVNSISPTWDAVDGATSYNYKVTLNGGSAYGPVNVGNVTSLTGAFAGEGVSTFSVQTVDTFGVVSDWSAPCTVIYDKTNPGTPTGGAPNNKTIVTNDFYFTWSDVADAGPAGIKYEFQSSTNSSQSGGVLSSGVWNSEQDGSPEQKNLTSPSIHSVGAGNGAWYWQVRTFDAAGNKSAWSPIWRVTINKSAPTLQTPADGSVLTTLPKTQKWSAVTGATKYEYESYYSNPSTDPSAALSHAATVNGTSRTIGATAADDEYWWRVRAVDSLGNKGPWSQVWKFSVDVVELQLLTIQSTPNQVTVGEQVTITGTTSLDAQSVELSVNGGSLVTVPVTNGQWSYTYTPTTAASYEVKAVAVDAFGNKQPASVEVSSKTTAFVAVAATVPGGEDEDPDDEPAGPVVGPISGDDGGQEGPLEIIAGLSAGVSNPLTRSFFGVAVDDILANDQEQAGANETAPAVLGSSDTKKILSVATPIAATDKGWLIIGLAWYWWLLIIALVVFGWWVTVAWLRRRDEEPSFLG